MSASHFTAVVEIQEVKVTPPTPARSGTYGHGAPDTPGSREVIEVARIVVRAADLGELREKVAAHVALIDA